MYPGVGRLTVLVYRECPCGRWCATGEGVEAPVCSACGGWYLPGGGPQGQFGSTDGSDPSFGRRTRGLGFAAVLMGEQVAVALARRVREGLWGKEVPAFAAEESGRPARYYSEREVAGRMVEMQEAS